MTVVTSSDVTYESVDRLNDVFLAVDMKASRVKGDLANDRVDVLFPSTEKNSNLDVVVMIWVQGGIQEDGHELLKFRVQLFDKKEMATFQKGDDLWDDIEREIDMMNQDAYGFVATSNFLGITLDYTLTMAGGVLDSTVINSAKNMALKAQSVKSIILDEVAFAD
ncbi:hypothetical protein [Pseudodesulfovibrio portus]|uniref:Uncharacterized protein n=1 Tax=Pseudodesulfovibrio portus TaxID=231439 RepID=A0ABN6RTL4_9BACT|nr:hypothetical protein [Pseudodesulfovibrio portus]BDQ33395.1 hypothetical protein JCM14722_09370 [Pseudodesulfovibrio portus]